MGWFHTTSKSHSIGSLPGCSLSVLQLFAASSTRLCKSFGGLETILKVGKLTVSGELKVLERLILAGSRSPTSNPSLPGCVLQLSTC